MQLTDKLHQLRIDFEIPLGPGKTLSRFVNVLIIFGEKITLVDSGVKGTEKQIFDYIRSHGRSEAEIETIILSHSHPDHIGGAYEIQKHSRCRILAHAGEQNWIEHVELQNAQRPVPGFFTLVNQSVKVDEVITENRTLSLQSGITLQLIHSPGHSAGSLNILFVEDRVLFTADSIPLKNDIPNYDNYQDLVNSLNAIKNSTSYHVLLTSWTPELTDRRAIDQMLDEAEQYMNSIDTVVKEIYSRPQSAELENCRLVIEKLQLPSFFAMPIVDKAFSSHFTG